MPLAAPDSRATSDYKIIGEHAWRLLKSFNFDPRELRGIGIQIQKLESATTTIIPEAGQAQLPFKRLGSPQKLREALDPTLSIDEAGTSRDTPELVIQPPSDDIAGFASPEHLLDAGSSRMQVPELPSFSQVDKSVFEALPDDLRMELETEYKRRSHSPAPLLFAAPNHRPEPKDFFPKITVKGTNFKRITQQLAPKNRSVISPKKHSIFARGKGVSITDEELRELDIDPEFFALLPADMHREQIDLARQAKKSGGIAALVKKANWEYKPIKVFQRISRSPMARNRKPAPKANHPNSVGIKRPGTRKGEHLLFTDTEDIQNVIQAWVEAYGQWAPQQKDVERFAKFLIQSADSKLSTDIGMEKAVAVLKWWLVLLRRNWGTWEHVKAIAPETGSTVSEIVGKAWWAAFRQVKDQVDVVARKKFGGCISLR